MYPRNPVRFHASSGVVDRLQRQIIAERRAAADEIARLRAALQEKEAHLRIARSRTESIRRDAEAAREESSAVRQELAAVRQQLAEVRQVVAEPVETEALEDARRKLHRLAADMANLRRRQSEEIGRAKTEARSALLREFVEILDGMERALVASDEPDSPWYRGSEALKRQMERVLERAGVSRLGDVGEVFDPRVHEAVGTTWHTDQPVDHIAATVQPGYRFADGALIRAARVIVSA